MRIKDSDTNKPYVRRRVLLPVTVVVLGIIMLFSVFGYIVLLGYLDHKIRHELEEVDSLFSRLLATESRGMRSQLALIAEDQRLIDAWKAGDRETLATVAVPMFETLKANGELTHFYFIQPDRTCFLRAHAPTKHGDTIDRLTLNEAARTGAVYSGIELGVYGTFTLRTVHPWVVDGERIGYIELGEEISHITPQLQWVTNLDIVLTIKKSLLTRADWETGTQFLGKHGDWEQFDEFIIMDTSFSKMTESVKDYLADSSLHKKPHEVHIGDAEYLVAAMPLKSADGKQVGEMFVAYNATDILGGFRDAVGLAIVITVVLALIMLGVFHFYLGRIDRELAAHRSNLEGLVAQRTAELEAARKGDKAIDGVLPICSSCKKIRDDDGQWKLLELYISQNTSATFDHCVCDACLSKQFPSVSSIRNGSDKLDDELSHGK